MPKIQSLRALPQSTRQFVLEQATVQSMYAYSHSPSHLTARSWSLKTHNENSDKKSYPG